MSFSIATRYGLDGPGTESRWGRGFPHPFQTGPGGYPTNEFRIFPAGKAAGGGCVDHPPPSCGKVKERVELYLYYPFWAFVTCSRVVFTFTSL